MPTPSEAGNSGMQISLLQKFIVTLWPSFMIAILATGLFFSAFHPQQLTPFDLDIEVNTLGAYTLGFFIFWVLSALSSSVTLYFAITNCRKIHTQKAPPKPPVDHPN